MHKSKLKKFGVRTHELLSKQTQRKIKGGLFATCTVTCSDGTKITCSGTSCSSTSTSCTSTSGNSTESVSCPITFNQN
jgi:hypothetical protein